MVDYLPKPVGTAILLAYIRARLRERERAALAQPERAATTGPTRPLERAPARSAKSRRMALSTVRARTPRRSCRPCLPAI